MAISVVDPDHPRSAMSALVTRSVWPSTRRRCYTRTAQPACLARATGKATAPPARPMLVHSARLAPGPCWSTPNTVNSLRTPYTGCELITKGAESRAGRAHRRAGPGPRASGALVSRPSRAEAGRAGLSDLVQPGRAGAERPGLPRRGAPGNPAPAPAVHLVPRPAGPRRTPPRWSTSHPVHSLRTPGTGCEVSTRGAKSRAGRAHRRAAPGPPPSSPWSRSRHHSVCMSLHLRA